MEPHNANNAHELAYEQQLRPEITTKTEHITRWWTIERVGEHFKMAGPFLENACKYMEKKTEMVDGEPTTFYKVSWTIETTTLVTPALANLIADMPTTTTVVTTTPLSQQNDSDDSDI